MMSIVHAIRSTSRANPRVTCRGAIPETFDLWGSGPPCGKAATRDVTKLIGSQVFAADVLTLKGVDDRLETKQVRQTAEQLAAEAWGAESCFFSSNGSTLSGQAAILACAGPGDKVLVARNAINRRLRWSLYAGLDLVPLEPEQDAVWNIEHGVSAAEVERKLISTRCTPQAGARRIDR